MQHNGCMCLCVCVRACLCALARAHVCLLGGMCSCLRTHGCACVCVLVGMCSCGEKPFDLDPVPSPVTSGTSSITHGTSPSLYIFMPPERMIGGHIVFGAFLTFGDI